MPAEMIEDVVMEGSNGDSGSDEITAHDNGHATPDKPVQFKVSMDGLPLEYVYRNLPAYLNGLKPGHYLFKILVPSNVAGSIIGKGGVQIKELQTTYEVSIKLSQNNQFYPESNKMSNNERIVLVQGPLERLVQVAEFIQTLVRNPPMERGLDIMSMDNGRRKGQMKIVVTNTTAGMIIGKGGETIKSLNEKYDVRIQLSQKDEIVLGERVVTITGEEDGINRVIEYIVKEKIRDDPTANSLSSLDYSGYVDSMGQNNQGGSNNPYGSYNDGASDMSNVGILSSLLSSGGQQQNSYNSYLPQQHQQSQGYNSAASLGNQGGNNNAEVLAQVLSQLNSSTLASALVQALSGKSAGGASQGGPQQAPNQQVPPPIRQQLRAFISRPDDVKYRVAIPDSLVGRILGRMGCTITEIQNATGCEIKISQRGEFMPGTQNRILYISGQNSACLAAQQMVLQKIEGDAKDINSGDFVFEQIPN